MNARGFGATLAAALLAMPAAAVPIPRKVLALYRTAHIPEVVKDPFFLPTHQHLEMPLNWLGLELEHVNIDEGLPNEAALSGVRGIIFWLPTTHAFTDPRPLCRWLDSSMRRGIKVLVFGEMGFHRQGAPGLLDVDQECKEMLSSLGLRYEGIRAFDPLDVAIGTASSSGIGFERKVDLSDSSEFRMIHLSPGATPYLRLDFQKDPNLYTTPVAVTARGGVALTPFALYSNLALNPPHYAWVVEPFKFLAESLGLKGLPRPDVTTINGRRVYTSHIDGDGLRLALDLDERVLC